MIFERKSFLFIQLDMMSLALSQSIYINDGYKKLENISDSHKCVVICYLRQQQEILFVDTLQNSYFNLLEVATIILLQSVCNFKVGDRVKLREGKTGVVKYIGKPEFPQEELVGIELDTWSANARDGSIGDQKFFKTSSGRGYFTPNTSVANIIKAKITEGAYARLKGMLRIPKFNGKTVKIVAYVQKKERWKVKLLHAKQEKRYLGVREENLDPILDWEPLNESNEVKIEGLKFEPMIGDRVQTRNGRYGIVKYVGKVDNSKSVYVGLKLEEYDPNAHDGTFKDHKYFECMDHRGYFVKLENLIENLGKANDGYTNLQNIGDYEKCLVYGYLRKQQEILFSHKLKNHYFNLLEVASIILFQSDGVLLKPKIGDRVILLQGKTGLVKYIGTTQFSNGKEVIGLELDIFYAEGSEQHKKYFNAPKGHGYFTKRTSISSIIMPDKTTKRLISKTKKKLRVIEVLELKHKNGVVLHPNQIAKINRKDELTKKLKELHNGKNNDNKDNVDS